MKASLCISFCGLLFSTFAMSEVIQVTVTGYQFDPYTSTTSAPTHIVENQTYVDGYTGPSFLYGEDAGAGEEPSDDEEETKEECESNAQTVRSYCIMFQSKGETNAIMGCQGDFQQPYQLAFDTMTGSSYYKNQYDNCVSYWSSYFTAEKDKCQYNYDKQVSEVCSTKPS